MVGSLIRFPSGSTYKVDSFDKELNRWRIKSNDVAEITMLVTHEYIDSNATFIDAESRP